jgi:hypothetical protein
VTFNYVDANGAAHQHRGHQPAGQQPRVVGHHGYQSGHQHVAGTDALSHRGLEPGSATVNVTEVSVTGKDAPLSRTARATSAS